MNADNEKSINLNSYEFNNNDDKIKNLEENKAQLEIILN